MASLMRSYSSGASTSTTCTAVLLSAQASLQLVIMDHSKNWPEAIGAGVPTELIFVKILYMRFSTKGPGN